MWSSTKIIITYSVVFNSLRMLIGATSSIYLLSKGVSLVDLGLMKTMQASVFFILDIPTSYLADKISRKYAIALSVFFGGAWLVLTGVSSTLYGFYLAEFFNAISLTIIGGTYNSYLIDVYKSEGGKDTHRILGINGKYHYMSMAIAAMIGAAIGDIDSRWIWILAGTGSFILMFFSFFLPESKVKPVNGKKSGLINDIKEIYSLLIKGSKGFLFVFFSVVTNIVYFQILLQYWQPYAFHGFSGGVKGSLSYGILFVFMLMAQSVAGWIISKISDNKKLIWFGFLLMFVSSGICLPGGKSYPYLIPVALIFMFGSNQYLTMGLRAVYHDYFDASLRSTFDSLLSTFARLIVLILFPAVAYFTETFGWQIMSYSLIILSLMVIFLYVFSLKLSLRQTH
ncbi:MFS transporter [Photorhabdus sp. RM323S]|uniref:MFS transporter n=1 Tax=Photorhabdus sp. RM323S TaxID=3342828 RepID=UPI0036DE6774